MTAPARTTEIISNSPSVTSSAGRDRAAACRKDTVVSRHSSWKFSKLDYWTECSGRSRRTGLRTSHPAPPATPAQALLESHIIEQLGMSTDLSAHPFGIAAVTSSRACLTLHLDPYIGRQHHSFPAHCLSRLLPTTPAAGSGDEPRGILGLRISAIDPRRRQMQLHLAEELGHPTSLVLALPSGTREGWELIERRYKHWYEANGLRPLWRTPRLDRVESAHIGAYPSLEDSRAQRAPMGSALLRRTALFHTVAAFYRVQCWDDGAGWKIDARTAHPLACWHDQLLQRLCHPRWGLPVTVSDRFCFCAEPNAPYQWGHSCSFYFDRHDKKGRGNQSDPIYLRIHASPEGGTYDRQIETLSKAGAPSDWMARAFPSHAIQQYGQRH
ncbi:hypothetical protein [Streptomyces aureus]|uniref:hypothetical protein n=1 Tax=Streptomyces aureus TaxID=193461 RepID=UPI0033CAF7C9